MEREKYGLGKYYDNNGNLILEVRYFNDKRWEGKIYDKSNNIKYKLKNWKEFIKGCNHEGKLIYEGEYLNGERNGRGKEYYDNGQIKYKGEYLYDLKIKDKYYVIEKLEYEGDFLLIKNGMEKDMMKMVILYMN